MLGTMRCWVHLIIFIAQSLTFFQCTCSEKSSSCRNSIVSHTKFNKHCSTQQQDFQAVTELLPIKVYVYSAYEHGHGSKSTKRSVVILLVAPHGLNSSIQCNFYNANATFLHSTLGTIKQTFYPKETFQSSFPYDSGSKIHCPIQGKQLEPPTFVGVTTFEGTNEGCLLGPSNCLPIRTLPRKNHKMIEFAACIQATFNYDNLAQFLEWTEFQILMGVSHFTLNNYSIGPEVSCAMKTYGRIMDVHPFVNYNLSTGTPKGKWSRKGHTKYTKYDVFYYNSALAISNCLYGYRGRAKYILIFDLDEMIVPKLDLNYAELLQRVNKKYQGTKIAAYRFVNQYFYTFNPDYINESQSDDDDDDDREGTYDQSYIKSHLVINMKITRTTCSDFHNTNWGKCIFRPDKVNEATVHRARKIHKGYAEVFVPEEFALSNHYRAERREESTCESYLNDTSGHKFVHPLAIRIGNKLKQLEESCKIQPNIFNK